MPTPPPVVAVVMPIDFAQAVDTEILDALTFKLTQTGVECLVAANAVLERFLTRLGVQIDLEAPEFVPALLKGVAGRVENGLLGPV